MKKPEKKQVVNRLHARPDRDMWRVWREDWFNDQFEVMEQADFDKLQSLLTRFNISIEIHEDDS